MYKVGDVVLTIGNFKGKIEDKKYEDNCWTYVVDMFGYAKRFWVKEHEIIGTYSIVGR